jgi:phosphonate transport system substrate-binding protein
VFALGDPNSTSGYLVPTTFLPLEGYSMEDGEFFAEVKLAGGHEQTIVGVNNGDFDLGVTWADGLGDWEDGYNSGALRKAVDSGLIDMNDLVQVWQSPLIPEGPVVLRTALPADVKATMTELMDNLEDVDRDCLYGVIAGDAKGFDPIDHAAYESIIAMRKDRSE